MESKSDRAAASLRWFSRLCALVAMTVGATALLGWIREDETLKSAFAGGIIIKANTAVALVLAGASLLLLLPEGASRWRRWPGRACAVAVALVGALTLSEHLIGWDLGIDQILFTEAPGVLGSTLPNRMGPPASISFPLLGAALCLLEFRTRRGGAPAQILALTAAAIALLPILGYAYGVDALFGVGRFTGIALNTALSFELLALGILCARPRAGIASLLTATDGGGILLRRMLAAAIFLPLGIGWCVLRGHQLGYYGPDFGTSLLALSFVLIFTGMLFWNSGMLARNTRARLRAESAEHELKDRIVRILENISQGFYAFDRDGRCTYANREGARLAGRSAAELLGQGLDQILPATSDLRPVIASAREEQRPTHVELFHSRLGAWHEYDVVPAADGFTLFTRDVTEQRRKDAERRELLESERAARNDAERASRIKDEFLATLSHELRTPLSAILGWSQMLASGRVPPKDVAQGLATIERNARVQAQLIEDLLEMSRIVSGKVRLDVQQVDLAALIESALPTVVPSAEAKDIRLQKILDPRAGPVRGDPARLQQVLWNLLSNAIKFTPRGGRVQITLARVNSHVEIAVADTGVGIQANFLPHVFERFRQADGSTTRTHGGLGIGLAIVRHLVELHGGHVQADSAGEGQGSTFTVRLPLSVSIQPQPDVARVHPTSAPERERVEPRPSLEGVRVLVVDDQSDAREMVGRMLSEVGAQVVAAEGADEALRQLDLRTFDVLISDIGMPRIDGYELIREVRKRPHERGGQLPAMALTAFARPEDRERTLLAGYRLHLDKPVRQEMLIAAVASLAERTGLESSSARGSAAR